MKIVLITTTFIVLNSVTFGQQPQKQITLTNKEKNQQAAAKEYIVRVENENNQMAADALKKLKDTTLSIEERKIYIDNYRKSVRNGNSAIKKKSFDLSADETLNEYLTLSKSPKFNSITQKTCLEMRNEIIARIDRQKAIDADPLADENSEDFKSLQDSTIELNDFSLRHYINGYLKFKLNSNDPDREKKKALLLEMSTSPKFDKKTQKFSLLLHNEYN